MGDIESIIVMDIDKDMALRVYRYRRPGGVRRESTRSALGGKNAALSRGGPALPSGVTRGPPYFFSRGRGSRRFLRTTLAKRLRRSSRNMLVPPRRFGGR